MHFDVDKCEEFPMKERCPVKIGTNVTTLTKTESEYAGALRHHQYMGDTDYRKECAVRAGAEATVNSKSKCSWNEKGEASGIAFTDSSLYIQLRNLSARVYHTSVKQVLLEIL